MQDTVSADVVSSTEQILEQAEAADSKVTLNLYRNSRSLFDNINGMCSVFGGKIIAALQPLKRTKKIKRCLFVFSKVLNGHLKSDHLKKTFCSLF